MGTPTLANVPRNQLRGLPVLQTGGSAGNANIVGGNVVRKWSSVQTGLDVAAAQTDANGHVYLATNFLDLSGCRAFTAMIVRTGAVAPLVAPNTFPVGGSGAWGLAGAANYATALLTNDGDSSYVQSADAGNPLTKMRVALTRVGYPGTAGWTINLVARGASLLASNSPDISVAILTGCDAALGGGVFVFGHSIIMPVAVSPSGYATFSLPIGAGPAAAIVAATAAPGTFVTVELLNSFGGTVPAVVNATQLYMDVGGALVPSESTMVAWFQQRTDSADVAPTSLPGLNLDFCGMSRCNATPINFPAMTALGQSQRALCSWDMAEVAGSAGTVGSEQADARVILSFGTGPADPSSRYSVTLWGTT